MHISGRKMEEVWGWGCTQLWRAQSLERSAFYWQIHSRQVGVSHHMIAKPCTRQALLTAEVINFAWGSGSALHSTGMSLLPLNK